MSTTADLPPYYLTPPSLRSSTIALPELLDRCGLTSEKVQLLRGYGDLLIPEDGDAPRFSEADPDGEVLMLAIEQMGHRLAQILATLETTPETDDGERLAAFAAADPDGFSCLRDVLVCCYLSTQRVWELLGYNGRKPRPPRPGEAEMYLVGGILDPVIERGPIYRLPDS